MCVTGCGPGTVGAASGTTTWAPVPTDDQATAGADGAGAERRRGRVAGPGDDGQPRRQAERARGPSDDVVRGAHRRKQIRVDVEEPADLGVPPVAGQVPQQRRARVAGVGRDRLGSGERDPQPVLGLDRGDRAPERDRFGPREHGEDRPGHARHERVAEAGPDVGRRGGEALHLGLRARVRPEDGGGQGLAVGTEQDDAVHLAAQPDRGGRPRRRGEHGADGVRHGRLPVPRLGLRGARTGGADDVGP